jgi:glycosyltransferase involved in cell wall biosynthesis
LNERSCFHNNTYPLTLKNTFQKQLKAYRLKVTETGELLITDDCSTDNTVEIIQKIIRSDHRIKLLILKQNLGAGIARNQSIKNANGKFIAFCDSDDQWLPEKLATQISFMLKNDLTFTYSSYYTVDVSGNRKGMIKAPSELTYSMLLRNNYVWLFNSDL